MTPRFSFVPSLLASMIAFSSTAVWADGDSTPSPIKHVIVVIGENHSFDNLFATYQPLNGQSINNMLSEGILNATGGHGANFNNALQSTATNTSKYSINPTRTGIYGWMPQVNAFGPINDVRYSSLQLINGSLQMVGPYNGPFQITGPTVPYATPLSVTGSPVHRFFQMWQETGGSNQHPDLWVWTPSTTGQGGATTIGGQGPTPSNPMNGSEAMGFFNMAQGDAPYFKSLADQYAMSDNFHQSVMGGTGMNFYAVSTGGVLPVYNVNGQLAVPPANQIENPDPQPGTNNFFANDGYFGGSYVNCSDVNQPGVAAITSYLQQHKVDPKCTPGAYYLVNNYNLPYNSTGIVQPQGATVYNFPPQTTPTIADLLTNHKVSWKWYTGGRESNDFVSTYFPGTPTDVIQNLEYNNLGDPLVANTRVMTGPMKDNLQGLSHFYADVANNTLPAVTFVIPPDLQSGHPGQSAPVFYEGWLSTIINQVQANPSLWQNTAIIVTSDEGGGYYDSGLIQPLDFFGDGTRISMMVVSPFAKKGYIDHEYADHSSILKFIEKNWGLPTISSNSRDNLPTPKQDGGYLPSNGPAIGDLKGLFTIPDTSYPAAPSVSSTTTVSTPIVSVTSTTTATF